LNNRAEVPRFYAIDEHVIVLEALQRGDIDGASDAMVRRIQESLNVGLPKLEHAIKEDSLARVR
jgi:DNA-binding GntR family transcriptional regulator